MLFRSVTAHNHGFAVDAPLDEASLTPYGRVRVSHVCLNDDVVEGLELRDADGNLKRNTIQDIRSMATTSDSAHFTDYYTQVADAARDAMTHSIYMPAHRGGCAVEQVIRQSFFVSPTRTR